jgi:hypothetical protein
MQRIAPTVALACMLSCDDGGSQACDEPGSGPGGKADDVDEDGPALFEEVIAPGEEGDFERAASEVADLQIRASEQTGGERRRGFHSKGHACLQGSFTVDPDLPADLQVGPVFGRPGTTFPTWIRYSNGSPFLQKDLQGDFRGLALKLVGVDGAKIMSGKEDAVTQDFLLLNNPFMIAPDANAFMEFVRAGTTGNLLDLVAYLRTPGNEAVKDFVLHRIFLRVIPSVRDQRFWSGSPFKFGERAIRYSVVPCDVTFDLPGLTNDYLRRDLVSHLEHEGICYDFFVQLQMDTVATPIENASDEWTVEESPPLHVAQVVMEPRDFASAKTQAEEAFCETLSFTPWHAAPEYRPMGSINRVRLLVYQASQTGRASAPEPDGAECFDCD